MQTTSTQPIQLIAIDIDGTLLNSQHELTDRTEKALKAAISRGVKVVLATGKTFHSCAHLTKRLNLTTPGIYNQGTTTYNNDGTIHTQQTLPPQIVRQVLTFGEDRGYMMALYSGGRILVRGRNPRLEELSTSYHEPMPEIVGSLNNLVDNTPINKVMAIWHNDGRKIKALRWQLSMQLNGAAKLMQAGVDDMLEILPLNASKGAALKALLKEMGIPASAVLAIGDAENDIEMIQLAGVGVAMGHAAQNVKDVAKAVVGTNNQDGVAEAVEKFVLPPPAPPAPPASPEPAANAAPAAPVTEAAAPSETKSQ